MPTTSDQDRAMERLALGHASAIVEPKPNGDVLITTGGHTQRINPDGDRVSLGGPAGRGGADLGPAHRLRARGLQRRPLRQRAGAHPLADTRHRDVRRCITFVVAQGGPQQHIRVDEFMEGIEQAHPA